MQIYESFIAEGWRFRTSPTRAFIMTQMQYTAHPWGAPLQIGEAGYECKLLEFWKIFKGKFKMSLNMSELAAESLPSGYNDKRETRRGPRIGYVRKNIGVSIWSLQFLTMKICWGDPHYISVQQCIFQTYLKGIRHTWRVRARGTTTVGVLVAKQALPLQPLSNMHVKQNPRQP